MPSALPPPTSSTQPKEHITKFTNCRLILNNTLVHQNLWISSLSGKIIRSQEAFYSQHTIPDTIIDLNNKILSPGFIDVQLNGAFGFDFSVITDGGEREYQKRFREVNRRIVRTGVTSYLPTLTSQRKEVYHTALPHLGPSGSSRLPSDGAESLGAHCEGPFLNPTKNGIHKVDVMRTAIHGFDDLIDCYGSSNINLTTSTSPHETKLIQPRIKMITAAPELASMSSCIPELVERGILFSMGHTEATYEEAQYALSLGASMITHLFNAMRPLHHRNPGPFGTLGTSPSTSISTSLPPSPTSPTSSSSLSNAVVTRTKRPYFGIIADSIHLHPTSIKIAHSTHPAGFILVTDAMSLLGLPDGTYPWTNNLHITKSGFKLTLANDPTKIAGSAVTLIECVNNFWKWAGVSVAEALRGVTSTPAEMLGLKGVKGTLEAEGDADLVVLDEVEDGEGEEGGKKLVVEQVWKFGVKVFDREDDEEEGSGRIC